MFTIIKTVSGVWYHLFNNGDIKVHLSDFDVIIDAIAETYVIEAKNGSNIPSKAISISDIRVIDESVSTTIPIAFSGATGLIELLTSLGYPPYLSNAPSQPPVKIYTKGQTAFFTNITQAWIDANFDNTGLGILEAIGWEKVPQLDGKVPIGQTTGGLFDNIGNSYGFANTVLVAHEADSAVFSDGKKGVNTLGTGATVSGYVLVEDPVTAKTVKTSKVGQDHTGAPSTVETGANKNYQPSLIVLYVRRTEDLWIMGGSAVPSLPNVLNISGRLIKEWDSADGDYVFELEDLGKHLYFIGGGIGGDITASIPDDLFPMLKGVELQGSVKYGTNLTLVYNDSSPKSVVINSTTPDSFIRFNANQTEANIWSFGLSSDSLGGGSVTPSDLISTDADNALVVGTDSKLFVPNLSFNELSDVEITSPTNNQIPAYESATSLWKNKSITDILGYTPIKKIVSDTTSSSAVTGVTTETLCKTYTISANTFSDGDFMKCLVALGKTGTAGTATVRIRVNQTNNFATATLVGTYTPSAGTHTAILFKRDFLSFKSGVLKGINFTVTTQNDLVAGASYLFNTTTLSPTAEFYFYVSVINTSGADSTIVNQVQITN